MQTHTPQNAGVVSHHIKQVTLSATVDVAHIQIKTENIADTTGIQHLIKAQR